MPEMKNFNKLVLQAVYLIREMYAEFQEIRVSVKSKEEELFIRKLAEDALYPEKPDIVFLPEQSEETECGQQTQLFSFSELFADKKEVTRFVICGGVDDGKSTLVGRILYETKTPEEQEKIKQTPDFLRKDKTVDYALLAGMSEEEAKQGITVQVSYSTFETQDCGFLLADVPGHEEYTCNMAYAAANADAAVIMIAANKEIVIQTRRHTRICYFMGIRHMIFAVNKMDMVSYSEQAFKKIVREITDMMQEYPGCFYQIIPTAAKTGENIKIPTQKMPWYKKETLLLAIEGGQEQPIKTEETFCMPVQRICKSSQIPGQEIKHRVIQGEAVSGEIACGDELFIYPTMKKAKVSKIYSLNHEVVQAKKREALGLELEQELDVARGYLLTKEEIFTTGDRIEADILWMSDNRLMPGKRYLIKIGTKTAKAVITKICYRVDVNTGEHKHVEYLMKNGMARVELRFPEPIAVACAGENRSLGTFLLMEKEENTIAGYGNIMRTISEDAWKEDGREVTIKEREEVMGQKSGLILFPKDVNTAMWMNYVERYLLGMGYHTIQLSEEKQTDADENLLKQLICAGLIILMPMDRGEIQTLETLFEEENRIFDCREENSMQENMAFVLKKIKQWAEK